MIEIIRVAENSIAATGGIQDGDRLISINNSAGQRFFRFVFHQVDEN
jgi:C-terminal processing protease CtpA/Prc